MEASRFSEDWAASFRTSPFRLRFELGGEEFGSEAPVPRFVQAFGRARQVAYDVLSDSRQVLAVIGRWKHPESDLFSPSDDPFKSLKGLGFIASPIEQWSGSHPLYGVSGDDEEAVAEWRAFDATERLSDRDVIIWCAIAREVAIYPKAPVTPFLIDIERSILVHIYDDRGMDVIALARDTLIPVYRALEGWLLDDDRPRIAEAFGLPE